MTAVEVRLERVEPRTIAAVRAEVEIGRVGESFHGPLDEVWAFLREHPGLRTDGHNLFLYHHPAAGSTGLLTVDFGVEVVRPFADEGAVRCVATPAGEIATADHRGPIADLHATHTAIQAWCRDHGRGIGAASWEIYGDWTDPERLETTIAYLLT